MNGGKAGERERGKDKKQEGSDMPGILVSKLLKLQYVHKLQKGGTHHIDLVHLMAKKLTQKQTQTQTHKAGRYRLL